jgi:transcriptional regulator with XRE-family HTH domain
MQVRTVAPIPKMVHSLGMAEWEPAASFSDVIVRNIRTLRARQKLDQDDVVQGMRKLGFTNWHRQTMSKIELGKRRVTLEEVLGLAVVFRTSWGSLLFPAAGEVRIVALPSGQPVILPLQHEMPEGVTKPSEAES